MLRNDKPLYLPPGSIRALLALIVVVAYLFEAVSEEVALLVLGSYFVGRASQERNNGS